MSDFADSPEPRDNVEDWIADARQGSREALGKALDACRTYLLLVANKNFPAVLRPEEGPSDLVQRTIHQGMNKFCRFPGNTKGELLAWLKRILFNLTANDLKRNRRRPLRESLGGPGVADPVSGKEKSPTENLIDRVEHERLKAALAQLPEDNQRAIHLRGWERLSFKEIADRMGKPSEDAARKLWSRAVARLSELLGPDDAEQ